MSRDNKLMVAFVLCLFVGGATYISLGPGFSGFVDSILGKNSEYSGDGGMEAVFEVDASVGAQSQPQTVDVLRRRLELLRAGEPRVSGEPGNKIHAVINGIADGERVAQLLQRRAVLGFHLAEDAAKVDGDSMPGRVQASYDYLQQDGEPGSIALWMHKQPVITNTNLKDVEIGSLHDEQPFLSLNLDADGTQAMAQVTRDNVGKRMVVLFDGVVYAAPVIREEITNGRVLLARNFSQSEAYDLGIVLKSGPLPAPLKVSSLRTW